MNKFNKQFLYLFILIIIFLIPNLLLISVGEDSITFSPLKKVVFFIISVSIVLLPLLVLKPKTYVLISFLFTFFIVFEGYMIFINKAPASEEMYTTIFLTNAQESREFITSHLILVFFVIILMAIQAFLFLKIQRNFKLSSKQKIGIFLFSAIVFFSIFIRDYKFVVEFKKTSFRENLLFSLDIFNKKLYKTFPVSSFYKTVDVYNGMKKINKYQENIKDFRFGALKKDTLNTEEIYVLVIGESARKENFSLYGYSKNTTPLLNKVGNLTWFTNVTAPANLTSISVPLLLTRATPSTNEIIYKEPPVNRAFEEVGFKTYWLSNQPSGINGIIGMQARSSNIYKNISTSVDAIQYDGKLLDELDVILKDHLSKQKFIVIHTLGSHFRYNFRYPTDYEYFKPSISRKSSLNENNFSQKETIINTYDNSILYTDYIIYEIIERLEKTNSVSYMYYISDHGENLFDDEKRLFMHGFSNPSKYELEIPLIVWYSKEYKKKYPVKINELINNKNLKITGYDTFDTLLDLANIYYKGESGEKSFSNPSYKESLYREVLTPDYKVLKK